MRGCSLVALGCIGHLPCGWLVLWRLAAGAPAGEDILLDSVEPVLLAGVWVRVLACW